MITQWSVDPLTDADCLCYLHKPVNKVEACDFSMVVESALGAFCFVKGERDVPMWWACHDLQRLSTPPVGSQVMIFSCCKGQVVFLFGNSEQCPDTVLVVLAIIVCYFVAVFCLCSY